MGMNYIDAGMLKNAFLAGAKGLEANKEWINELNVFPVSEMERSGIELHDGVERRIYFIPRADTGAAPAPHVQPVKYPSHAPTQEPLRLRMSSP